MPRLAAQQDIEAVIPARRRRTKPQPHDPERYPVRHAVERGLGGRERGGRVATRHAPYAPRCLGFPYLAAAWIWLKSYPNATWSRRFAKRCLLRVPNKSVSRCIRSDVIRILGPRAPLGYLYAITSSASRQGLGPI